MNFTQFLDFLLLDIQSALARLMAFSLPIRGAQLGDIKFIVLAVIDYEERLIWIPFDRGKMDCYLFSFGPPCLQEIVICVKTDQSEFLPIQSIGIYWRYSMYGIVRDEIFATLPIFGKERMLMIMYIVDAISLYFCLVMGLATYKT